MVLAGVAGVAEVAVAITVVAAAAVRAAPDAIVATRWATLPKTAHPLAVVVAVVGAAVVVLLAGVARVAEVALAIAVAAAAAAAVKSSSASSATARGTTLAPVLARWASETAAGTGEARCAGRAVACAATRVMRRLTAAARATPSGAVVGAGRDFVAASHRTTEGV